MKKSFITSGRVKCLQTGVTDLTTFLRISTSIVSIPHTSCSKLLAVSSDNNGTGMMHDMPARIASAYTEQISASSRETLSSGFLTRSKTNRDVHPQIIICGCTAQFMSVQVGDRKDTFSCNVAHLNLTIVLNFYQDSKEMY